MKEEPKKQDCYVCTQSQARVKCSISHVKQFIWFCIRKTCTLHHDGNPLENSDKPRSVPSTRLTCTALRKTHFPASRAFSRFATKTVVGKSLLTLTWRRIPHRVRLCLWSALRARHYDRLDCWSSVWPRHATTRWAARRYTGRSRNAVDNDFVFFIVDNGRRRGTRSCEF